MNDSKRYYFKTIYIEVLFKNEKKQIQYLNINTNKSI